MTDISGTWGSKDPDDIATYSNVWTLLNGDTIATSTWITPVLAGLTLSAPAYSGATATVTLSGGTDGLTAVLVNRITTASGNQFDSQPIYLPIISTYPVPTAPVGYTLPTVAWLKLMYPAFVTVPDAQVQAFIDRAGRTVTSAWDVDDYADGVLLLACHLMVLSGLGGGAEAQAYANGMSAYQSVRSGQLSLTKGSGAGSGADGVPSPWNGSQYGVQFYWLAKRNVPGVAVALADTSAVPSAYAKDWPPGAGYGYPGIWY